MLLLVSALFYFSPKMGRQHCEALTARRSMVLHLAGFENSCDHETLPYAEHTIATGPLIFETTWLQPGIP
eukprot:5816081-Amphidinium_carterae.1